MKKQFITAIFWICLFGYCFGQKGSMSFYINNGINRSNIYPNSEYYSTKQSYYYGIGAKYEILKNLRLGIEGNMEEKGWFTGQNSSGQKMNYYFPFFSLPLMLDYALQFKAIKVFVQGGHFWDFRRKGGNILPQTGKWPPYSSLDPRSAPAKDLGWLYGLGIEWHFYKAWNIGIAGRYARSYTRASGMNIGNSFHQNFTYLLQLGYKIGK